MAKNLRAVDQELFTFKNKFDVHSRKYRTKKQIVIDLVLGVIAIVLGTMVLIHYETLIGAGISLLAGIGLLVYAKRAEKRKIISERSEFLNALLASAIGNKHKFCMIVNQDDGQIVYLNNDFQKTFPKIVNSEKRFLAKLLKMYSVSDAKSKSIMTAVKKAADKSVAVDISAGKGKPKEKLNFKIEPIARPSGFVMIRGE